MRGFRGFGRSLVEYIVAMVHSLVVPFGKFSFKQWVSSFV